MKAILMSIQPQWCELIANGKKTIEVRKTRPKLETPFKCYIYCSGGRLLYENFPHGNMSREIKLANYRYARQSHALNGKVIGEFVCVRINKYQGRLSTYAETPYRNKYISPDKLAKTCLSIGEINDYLNGKNAYLWHISDLKIYEKPRELSKFYKPLRFDGDYVICGTEREMKDIEEWDCQTLFDIPQNTPCDLAHCSKLKDFYRITKAPQSWCYAESC